MKAIYLDILLQEGEGVMLEYKEAFSFFARELVAFANTAGGRILLGVRDNGLPNENNMRQVNNAPKKINTIIKLDIVKREGKARVSFYMLR